jgi:hypothetical protein
MRRVSRGAGDRGNRIKRFSIRSGVCALLERETLIDDEVRALLGLPKAANG